MNDYQLKEQIFNDWFEVRVTKFKEQKNGKFCESKLIIKHQPFIRCFNSAYKRFMKHYNDRNECFMDCVMLIWEGMNEFEFINNGNWEGIANKTDDVNSARLIGHLKKFVSFELERRIYPKVKTSRTVQTEDGTKKYFLVYYNVAPETLHRLVNWKDEKVELINCMQESFWESKNDYQATIFIDWFNNNKEKILTKNQLELLKDLEKANYSILELEDFDEESIDISKNAIRQRLRRIRIRVANEYRKQKKFITGSFAIKAIEAEMKVYSKITNIINDDEIELNEMNAKVSAQILKSMNNTHFAKLVYDNLDLKDLKILIRIYNYSAVADEKQFQFFIEPVLPSKLIYKIIDLVEDRITELEISKEKEMRILESQKPKDYKIETVQFPIDTNKKCIHLTLNTFGIATPKYD